MDNHKISDNFQGTEGYKIISPHHSHPTNGVRPSDSMNQVLLVLFALSQLGVLLSWGLILPCVVTPLSEHFGIGICVCLLSTHILLCIIGFFLGCMAFDKIKPIEDNHKVSRKSGMIFFILSSVLCSIFIYLLKHM